MQDFNVTWNYVYTGTPIALKKKVNEQNFGSGLATRLTCIPLPTTHFETDEIDDQLAELIVNIQFACQRHYFGALAEKYFDDKLRDAATNHRHSQKTIEGYNRLPEEFTAADVMRCFMLNGSDAARMRIKRMQKDGTIEKAGEYVEDGTTKFRYRKKAIMVF